MCSFGRWRKTKAGLILIRVCTIIALVIWGLAGLILLIDQSAFLPGIRAAILVVLTYPILALGAFIGVCLCWTAPYPPAQKRAGTSALLVIGAVVVLMLVLLVAASPNCPPDQIMFLLFSLPFLMVIGTIVYWNLFCLAAADFFRDASLRKFSLLTMILTLASPLFFVFGPFILLGMNLALCIKTIRTIKQGTAGDGRGSLTAGIML